MSDKEIMFKQMDYHALPRQIIDLVGKNWALLSAGDAEKFNLMTISWGGFGYLWNKPVAHIYVRPQRYTLEFVDKFDEFTLSFLPESRRAALSLCGSKSGRDIDKLTASNLSAWFTPSGNPAVNEADIVIECKKLYQQYITPDSFIDKSIIGKWYHNGDFHKAFVAEIENVWIRQ